MRDVFQIHHLVQGFYLKKLQIYPPMLLEIHHQGEVGVCLQDADHQLMFREEVRLQDPHQKDLEVGVYLQDELVFEIEAHLRDQGI